MTDELIELIIENNFNKNIDEAKKAFYSIRKTNKCAISDHFIEEMIELLKELEYWPKTFKIIPPDFVRFIYFGKSLGMFYFTFKENGYPAIYHKIGNNIDLKSCTRENINQNVKEVMEMDFREEAFKKNSEKLDRFSKFEVNWDGYGANPFSPQVIEKAKKLLESLEYQPEIFPVPEGKIQFKYEKDNGWYVVFEISDKSDMIFGYKDNKTNKDIGGEIFRTFTNQLNDYVKDFMEKY